MKTKIIDLVINTMGGFACILFRLFGKGLITFVGSTAGAFAFHFSKRNRRIIQDELTATLSSKFSKEQILKITKDSLKGYYIRQMEMLFLGEMTPAKINDLIDCEGLENIDKALEKKNGVILLLTHFGSFLLPLPFLGHKGYPINQIAGREICNSLLQERIWLWRKRQSDKLPITFVQIGTFLRPIYKALKMNEIALIAFDGRESASWVDVDFMGRKVKFSPGPFELSKRTKAPIIPTFILRQKDGRHKLIFRPEFELDADDNKNTQRFAAICEEYLWQYPDHLGMVPHRFKDLEEEGVGEPFFVE